MQHHLATRFGTAGFKKAHMAGDTAASLASASWLMFRAFRQYCSNAPMPGGAAA
jgi:hypothetical protein